VNNRKRVRALYCEALREVGVLALVLSPLDATFSNVKVTGWEIASWGFGGLLSLCSSAFTSIERSEDA
jgi:hypothetical protein